MAPHRLLIAAWLGLCAAIQPASVCFAESRTWTDASGKFRIEAELLSYADGVLQLQKGDGKVVGVPLGKLSAADQRWLREELKRRKTTETQPVAAVAQGSASTGDWPQWRGPLRDGISQEKGLLHQWPEGGPPVAWSVRGLGSGHASLTIYDGKLYTMGRIDGTTHLICRSATDGAPLWSTPVGGGDSPNCTPSVDPASNLVVGVSHAGDLLCADAKTGEEVWRKNFGRDFEGRMMSGWGYSESPLFDGDAL
ncbi:MAG: PQQ-binding-like beta-propeller repeat protein, partial [Planctomycetales bacterium]|nr:PQQ-binding-like beta-propeller repeat protein [Planctomycetales bacterium]